MLQAAKCQVRLFAERANILKYDEKVHIGYVFVQHSSPILCTQMHIFLNKISRIKGFPKYDTLLMKNWINGSPYK